MARSNCLIFALAHWFRDGGYLIVRRSHWGWFPHFLWSQDLKVFEEFTPLRHAKYRLCPPLLFTGYVREGE